MTVLPVRTWSALAASLVVMIMATACDSFVWLDITNETDVPVTTRLFVLPLEPRTSPGGDIPEPRGEFLGPIPPGASLRTDLASKPVSELVRGRITVIEGLDEEGNVLFRREYRWEELEKLNFQIAIRRQ